MGGARYLDDFSRKALLYLLKTKDEAIVAFKNWKALVEVKNGGNLRN